MVMEKVFISGGTGLIGSQLAQSLAANNFKVFIITRYPDKFKAQHSDNIQYVKQGNSVEEIAELINNSHAVLNFAGASIAGKRWSAEYKKIIYDSRINTTRQLTQAILKSENPPKVFVSASAVGYYGDCGESQIDENTPSGNTFMARLCRDWEAEASVAESVTRVVLPRFGVVLSKNGGALNKMLLPFKMFMGGPLGNGDQWFPWIHISDSVEMLLWLMRDTSLSGAFNAVAPHQVRMIDFADALGKALHRPSWLKAPKFALQVLMGEGADFLLESQKIMPKRALDSGYTFKYPELRLALENIVYG